MNRGLLKMAEGYELLAAGLREMAVGERVSEPAEVVKEEKQAQKHTPKKEQAVTLEAVRAVLAEKSRDGKTQEVRALLNKHGADKLSAITDEKLPILLQEAEAL